MNKSKTVKQYNAVIAGWAHKSLASKENHIYEFFLNTASGK